MSATAIYVSDMHCAACVQKIESHLENVPLVDAVRINPVRRQLHITHRLHEGDYDLLQRIEALGFNPQLRGQAHAGDRRREKQTIKQLGIAGICMMQVMMATLGIYFGEFWGMEPFARDLLNWAAFAFCLPIIGYCATPFFSGAAKALVSGMNMDVPVALAISLAFLVSVWNLLIGSPEVYFDSVAMVTVLLLGARQIDASLRRKVSADDLVFAPEVATVTRYENGQWLDYPLRDVVAGDRLFVAEGAIIPVDATLEDKEALVDQASLSGESLWVAKQHSDTLFAGTINCGAGFECLAMSTANGSRAAQIHELADRVELTRAPFGRLADHVARWFIPAVLVAAAVTYAGWWFVDPNRSLGASLAVLIVSCPCALALAIPAALTASMAHLRRQGLLLVDSGFVELTPKITQVYIDKTGTLTLPAMFLQHIEPLGDYDESYCLALAAALQRYSSHPIAQAFRDSSNPAGTPAAGNAAFSLESVEVVAGSGVRGLLNGMEVRIGNAQFCGAQSLPPNALLLSLDRRLLARFDVGAKLRSDASFAISRLQQRGLQVTMLSGDQDSACVTVAEQLGIAFCGGMQPEDKYDYLQKHRGSHDKILFVGDGINDALAFSEADMSIATLETSDLVHARADATLLTSRLGAVADLFDVATSTRRVMLQNLGWALLYNLIAIPSAMLGLMPPWLAAIGMACSSSIVLLNATRLLGKRRSTGVAK